MASLLRDFDILLLGVLAKDTEAKLAKLEGSPALLLIVNRKAWRVFDRQIHFQILLLQFFGGILTIQQRILTGGDISH